MNDTYADEQERICRKYGAGFSSVDDSAIIGVARNLDDPAKIINGLRHPRAGNTSG